jgi:UDP-N-acetylenolpyruvoylglucosamine reductase
MRLFRDLKDGRKPGEVLADLGLCGIRLRGVTIDDRDPNRAINRGEGSAEDLQQLAQYVKRRASESAGVELEEAYRLIGKK